MRVERGWAIVLFAVGAALCFVPLFDVLGYEWCLTMALVSSLAGAHLGAAAVWRQRHERAPSAVTAAEAHAGRAVAALWGSATLRAWAGLVAPLLAILANALRVRNCDVGAGIGWFVMLPMCSAAMGAGAGVVAGLVRPWKRRAAATALGFGIVVGSIALGVWRFYAAPPIFGYDPFVGYFAGTLYDEDVAIGSAFLWARLYHATLLAAALAICARQLDGATLALGRAWWPERRGVRALTLVLVAGGIGLWLARAPLGFALSADDVARRLGAERRTAHFVFHYSPTGPYAKDIAVYAEDAELRWSELGALFGKAPPPPVHAFLFDNAGQKRALMGAAHTFIAKPWRREIYLQHDAWPQDVTWHELAHVFAGQYGDSIFGVSRRGLRFNVGLIEGIAVAASWAGNPLTPHQIVKVLRDAGIVDGNTLASVMGPRFFGINAAQAYNVAGSFCRFLIDTRGMDKLERLFHAAGSESSWREIYGVDFAALRDEWLRMLDAQTVPPVERAVALERLKRPSVFGRPCAHAQALLKNQARAAATAGDRARSLAIWDSVCKDDDSTENALDRVEAIVAAGDYARAAAELTRLQARADEVSRAKLLMLEGDVAVLRGETPKYDAVAALPLEESTARLATVKRDVSHWPPSEARTTLLQILAAPAGTRDAALDLVALQKLSDAQPDNALLHYLLGRQLYARGRFADAADELGRSLAGPLPDGRFIREAVKMRAMALFRLGKRAEAREIFQAMSFDPNAPEGVRLEAKEWVARCDFKLP